MKGWLPRGAWRATLVICAAMAATAGVGLSVVASGSAFTATSPLNVLRDKGPSPNPPGQIGPLHHPEIALPSPEPNLCGYWGSTYSAIANRFGEIRSCFALDADRSTWIVTTLGTRASHGVVGIYRCATPACHDGRNDHGFSGWKFYAAPYGGGVTILARPSSTTFFIDNGGHQLTFDLTSDTFA